MVRFGGPNLPPGKFTWYITADAAGAVRMRKAVSGDEVPEEIILKEVRNPKVLEIENRRDLDLARVHAEGPTRFTEDEIDKIIADPDVEFHEDWSLQDELESRVYEKRDRVGRKIRARYDALLKDVPQDVLVPNAEYYVRTGRASYVEEAPAPAPVPETTEEVTSTPAP